MKYRPSMKLCRLGGQVLGQYALKGLWKMDWDCITPVPSSPRSMRIRGFNQAQILGEEVRYSLRDVRRIPLRLDVLLYTGRHKPQASLDPAARFSNVRRMFKAGGRLDGKKILLVDDVLTTGATTNAAAKVLLDAGARDVDLLTLARSSTWGESRWRCSADPDCHFSAAAILRETRDRVKAGQENIECG